MGQTTSKAGSGRLFTQPKSKAYDQIKWVTRDSVITNPMTGINVFEQRGVEIPADMSKRHQHRGAEVLHRYAGHREP
jgi:hypothetical protein